MSEEKMTLEQAMNIVPSLDDFVRDTTPENPAQRPAARQSPARTFNEWMQHRVNCFNKIPDEDETYSKFVLALFDKDHAAAKIHWDAMKINIATKNDGGTYVTNTCSGNLDNANFDSIFIYHFLLHHYPEKEIIDQRTPNYGVNLLNQSGGTRPEHIAPICRDLLERGLDPNEAGTRSHMESCLGGGEAEMTYPNSFVSHLTMYINGHSTGDLIHPPAEGERRKILEALLVMAEHQKELMALRKARESRTLITLPDFSWCARVADQTSTGLARNDT